MNLFYDNFYEWWNYEDAKKVWPQRSLKVTSGHLIFKNIFFLLRYIFCLTPIFFSRMSTLWKHKFFMKICMKLILWRISFVLFSFNTFWPNYNLDLRSNGQLLSLFSSFCMSMHCFYQSLNYLSQLTNILICWVLMLILFL